MTQRRIERRLRANDLTVSVFDRAQQSYLGSIERTIWFDDVTQIKGLQADPWQDINANVQLKGRISDPLQKKMPWDQFEFYVSFTHQGEPHSGPVLITSRNGNSIVLHVQGGFNQQH